MTSPLGNAGEFYFENLPEGRHEASVTHEGRSCAFMLTVPHSAEAAITLGTLKCTVSSRGDPDRGVRGHHPVRGSAAGLEAAQCSVSATSVVFGTYNVFSAAPDDSTGTIVYRCNGGATQRADHDDEGTEPHVPPARADGRPTEKLAYNLFRDAARTTVWGDFSGGTSAYIDINPPNNQ